jgi:hypothetical protein
MHEELKQSYWFVAMAQGLEARRVVLRRLPFSAGGKAARSAAE